MGDRNLNADRATPRGGNPSCFSCLCRAQVLKCGEDLPIWAPDPNSTARTYRDLIVRDKDIVKIVLLLTGSIEGASGRCFDRDPVSETQQHLIWGSRNLSPSPHGQRQSIFREWFKDQPCAERLP